MCNVSVIEFFIKCVGPEEFVDKKVLEVGSKYVNGSVRPLIERFLHPREYIGIDIKPGKYVDLILPAEKILEYFDSESFDVVISTELLEHVRDYKLVIGNMKKVLKPSGHIYITTRSLGFPYHGNPFDFWRYELDDMGTIFSDLEIECLRKDHEAPGVFLKAKKPEKWKSADLSHTAIYSVVLGRRTKEIVDIGDMPVARRLTLKLLTFKNMLGTTRFLNDSS